MKHRIIKNRNAGKLIRVRETVTKADDASLTEKECWKGFIKVTAASKQMTLPAASASLEGCDLIIQGYTGTTVKVTAGFGGAGASFDTQTLADHTAGHYYCDGSYWYAIGQGTLA